MNSNNKKLVIGVMIFFITFPLFAQTKTYNGHHVAYTIKVPSKIFTEELQKEGKKRYYDLMFKDGKGSSFMIRTLADSTNEKQFMDSLLEAPDGVVQTKLKSSEFPVKKIIERKNELLNNQNTYWLVFSRNIWGRDLYEYHIIQKFKYHYFEFRFGFKPELETKMLPWIKKIISSLIYPTNTPIVPYTNEADPDLGY